MPRPFLPTNLKKEKIARIRFTGAEFKELKTLAAKQKLTLSSFFRIILQQYVKNNK